MFAALYLRLPGLRPYSACPTSRFFTAAQGFEGFADRQDGRMAGWQANFVLPFSAVDLNLV